jgi:hypothetical protein
MIKKLRNQPYAPKIGASSEMGAKRKKKKCHNTSFLQIYPSILLKGEPG